MTDKRRAAAFIPPIGVAAALLSLYLPVLGRTITWAPYAGDGGDLLAAALTGGVPHPSGYPTFMLLLRIFERLPFQSPYWKGALLSAVCSALAGGLLCAWIQAEALEGKPLAWLSAAFAGLAWGSAPLVWSQAVIVEVYALHALFIALFLWWFSRMLRPSPGPGWLTAALSVAMGLALGNHLTFALLAPPAVYAVYRAVKNGWKTRQLAALAGLAVLGMAVYIYLPAAASHFPPVNWGNPQTLEGFWWTVSGQPYRDLLFQTPPAGLLERIPAWANLLLQQFGIPGLALGAIGAVYSSRLQVPIRRLALWIVAVYSVFAIGYRTGDSLIYLIPAYLGWAIWLALGFDELLHWRWRALPLGAVAAAAAIVFLLLRAPLSAAQADPNRDARAQQFLSAFLQQAPQGAIAVTSADLDTFALWYALFGLKQRTDLRVLVRPLGQFAWYRDTVRHTYPDLAYPQDGDWMQDDWVDAIISANSSLPVCQTAGQFDEGNITFQCQP